jgi:hypothetical protein
LLRWLLCCCHVVIIVFVYFVAALPTPPLPPPPLVGMEVDGDGTQDDHNGVGRYLIVWAIKLSNGKNQEQRYTMAPGGHQTQIKFNNQPKTRALNGEEMRRGATGGEHVGSAI